jgi:hypothetical protein
MLKAIRKNNKLREFIPLLFSWIVVQTDDYGHFDADPELVKAQVMPFSSRSIKVFQQALDIMAEAELIEFYQEKQYLEIVGFNKFQKFRSDRAKQQIYPLPINGTDGHTIDIPVTDIGKLREVKVREENIREENGLGFDIETIVRLIDSEFEEIKLSGLTISSGVYQQINSFLDINPDFKDIEKWKAYFKIIKANDFLMGRGGTKGSMIYPISFNFLLKQETLTKAITGGYKNREIKATGREFI